MTHRLTADQIEAYRQPDPAKGVTSYGYKVLKFATRANP